MLGLHELHWILLGRQVSEAALSTQPSKVNIWLVANVLNHPQYTKVEYFENLLLPNPAEQNLTFALKSLT